jgi:PAS domain S-box-containing protein
VRFNRAGEDLLGWPRQSLVGKSDFEFWPQEQAEFFVEKDRETMSRGDVVQIDEEPIQTRYQGVRLLHTKKVPIRDPSGNTLYVLGISEDITERRRIEKERRLLEEHGHIRRLKVASADPGNAALCAVLEQMPPNRDLPHPARSVVESRRSVVIEHVTPRYLESVAQGPEHLRALRATGLTSLIAVPLLMRGELLGVLMFGSSNADRIYGQDDLRWAEPLADRSAVAIENARLYRASVEATQHRDQVLGVVAHDLRNPLATILMQTSARSRKPNEVIHRAATRMNRLIQDLLDVSLIEMGQLPIQRARLSGGELVVEAVETQKTLATSSSVELRLDVGKDVAEVWGQHDRLLQVFENLIGNAIKFTTAGGWITVGAASNDQEVVFWVADSGAGIEPGDVPHVFDRFWQATRGDRRGAGLGLPITKGIVEAHGGHIWVESTLGRGTTFFFSIPSARPTADQPSGVPA